MKETMVLEVPVELFIASKGNEVMLDAYVIEILKRSHDIRAFCQVDVVILGGQP